MAPDTWQVTSEIKLHHFSEGQGTPVVVVHGGPGIPPTAPWPGLTRLAERYRFHYYHQRGCGRSTRPIDKLTGSFTDNLKALNQTLGIAPQVADIERIRVLLGQEKLVLLGHSFGGFLAALYAAEFPERVQALVLVAPADVIEFDAGQDRGLFDRVAAHLPKDQKPAYEKFLTRYLDFGNIFAKTDTQLRDLNGEFAAFYRTSVAAAGTPVPTQDFNPSDGGGWMVQGMYLAMGRSHDYSDALKAVNAPVLVVHGARDLSPEAASRRYVDYFAHGAYHRIPNVGHFPHASAPDAFATAVGAFLDRTTQS